MELTYSLLLIGIVDNNLPNEIFQICILRVVCARYISEKQS